MINKLNGGQLAGGNSVSNKAEYDYYTTDPKTVELFLKAFHEDGLFLRGSIYEPACGSGNIVEAIKDFQKKNDTPYSTMHYSDLINRGYGHAEIDFLTHQYKNTFDTIVTNPPFSLLNEFIERGLELSRKYVIYFAKLQAITTSGRVEIYKKHTNLRYVYIHTNRQATWKNNEPLNPNTGKKWATTQEMAWFVWDKEYQGEPTIRWC